jgi:hypothetical protein
MEYTGAFFLSMAKIFIGFLLSSVDDITLWVERPSIGVIIPVLPFTILQV